MAQLALLLNHKVWVQFFFWCVWLSHISTSCAGSRFNMDGLSAQEPIISADTRPQQQKKRFCINNKSIKTHADGRAVSIQFLMNTQLIRMTFYSISSCSFDSLPFAISINNQSVCVSRDWLSIGTT